MEASFIEPSCSRWRVVLSALEHDVYHFPGYVQVSARHENGEPAAFIAQEGRSHFLVPLVIRPISPRLLDVGERLFDSTSPYGYPGPLLSSTHGSPDADFLGRAVEAFAEALRQRSIISAFVRLHPILQIPPEPLARNGTLVYHGNTVSIDLSLPEDQITGHIRRSHRKDVRRAQRRGYTARIDQNWERFDEFVEIYHQTMRRVRAEEYYFFPRHYFTELRQALRGRLHLSVVEVGRHVAAASLVTEVCGIVQSHLGGSRTEHLASGSEKVEIDFLRRWAQERGNSILHLGGGLGGATDSLFHFKAGFSKIRHSYSTWRVVADERAYRRLVSRWECRIGTRAGSPSGYFPAYRFLPDASVA